MVTGPVDIYNPGQLFNHAVDLNGTPGDGQIEQTITGLSAGQVYAFQLNFTSNGDTTRAACAPAGFRRRHSV